MPCRQTTCSNLSATCHRRVLRPEREAAYDAYDVDQCAAAVGASRVALMFLTRGGLPYEQLWAAWLGSAAGLLPAQHVQVHRKPTLVLDMTKRGADLSQLDGRVCSCTGCDAPCTRHLRMSGSTILE